MRPESYPLPWCERLDSPYWQINFARCMFAPAWCEWQAHKPMSEIIPVIDWLLDGCVVGEREG